MRADPLLLTAGEWLGVASAALLLLTLVAFVVRWGCLLYTSDAADE